jgi:type IV pilus assembly protein PilY1
MKQTFNKPTITAINFLLIACSAFSVSVLAEDIEIFRKENVGAGAVQPNVLFILDTSGSMNDEIGGGERAAYVGATDYSLLAGACFDNTRMYYLPAGDTVSDVECTNTFTSKYYLRSQNKCATAEAAFASNAGLFSTDWSQWKTTNPNASKGWNTLHNNTSNTNYIDCADDEKMANPPVAIEHLNYTSKTVPYVTDTLANWNNLSAARQNSDLTMYSGNYMNHLVTTTTTAGVPKIDIMREVIETTLYGVEGVNIGLMKFNYRGGSFNSNDGGVIKYAIKDAAAARADMVATMKTWNANGGTPLSEALYEGYRIFAGLAPEYPDRTNSESIEGDSTHVITGKKYYVSPVDKGAASCQKQYVILVSDGWPHSDATNDTDYKLVTDAIGGECDAPGVLPVWDGSSWSYSYPNNGERNGKCLDDLSNWMAKTGFPATLEDGTVIDNVKVITYGIGFGLEPSVLKIAAEENGGKYITAANKDQLTAAILGFLNDIKNQNTSFTSPAISVNAFNRSTHRSELYYTLFKPTSDPHWDGNLKRYKLNVATDGAVSIVDFNGSPAINEDSGFFDDKALSWWTSGGVDGDDSRKGGAASKLTSEMKVYTNISGDNLTASGNEFTSANLSYAVLGLSDSAPATVAEAAYRDTLLNWVRGMDVDLVNDTDNDGDRTDARGLMGDPLHASPTLVQYGGTEANPDITAYMATNDGFLHAINTSDGTEIFSFVPKELLGNLVKAYENDPAADKLYGLDGSIAAWVNDENKDGIISGNDHVYLYFGMGRGGRNVYAMDVTNRSAPKMLWTIHGGVDTGFTGMGLTFSTPVHRKIRIGGVEKHVVIFGGGYDIDQDGVYIRTADDVGRAIYIVDAELGNLLWRGDSTVSGLQDMNYSIPSDVAAVDVHGDGLIDRLYVGDMGGQLWRIYIDNDVGRSSSDMNAIVRGVKLADLADDDAISNRRFFYAPDVALVDGDAEADYLGVVITSGNRSHPLNDDVQDRVFMLKDRPVKSLPSSPHIVIENNDTHELYDASSNIWGELSTATDAQKETARAALRAGYGWYFDFVASAGEKGLAKPLILQGHVFFTTYTPRDPAANTAGLCGIDVGKGWFYDVLLKNAVEGQKYDGQIGPDGDKEARLIELPKSGIPPGVVYMKPPGVAGDCVVVGTTVRCLGPQIGKEKLYWFTR